MTIKKRMREGKGTALLIDRWGPSTSLRSAQDDKREKSAQDDNAV
jgi:hypothetical protein